MERFAKINDLITDKISGEWGEEVNGTPGVNVLRTTNFTNQGSLNLQSVVKRKISADLIAKKKLSKGDVIIEKSGGSPTQPVGRVVYFDLEGEDYLCNNFTAVLRPSKEIFPKYFFYALYFLHLSKRTLKYQNKTTGILNLKLERYLEEEQIKIPDLTTQKQIAQLLEEADIARQKRKASNALTDRFLQCTFLSMFGDPIENSKGWHNQQIRTLVHSIISGKSVQSEQRKKVNGEYGVLKVSAVTYGYFKPEEHKAISNGFVPDESIKPKKGDLLFSRANTKELVAATCIVDKDYNDLFLPDKLWKINLDFQKVNPVYFKCVLSHPSFRNKLSEKATGTSGSMFNISKEKLCEFDFPLPPISLQQKFASIVGDTEQLRQKQKQSEIELENLFQALLQKYFG